LRDLTLAYRRYALFASRQRGAGATELLALGYLRDRGPLTAGNLGTRLGLTSASVTALLDRLDKAGYAQRQPNPRDRRSLLVELTDDGRNEVESFFELLAYDIQNAQHGMTLAEQSAIARFLAAMTAYLEQRTSTSSASNGQ
jgi:DNA-binding MarR family transcriptional regulator